MSGSVREEWAEEDGPQGPVSFTPLSRLAFVVGVVGLFGAMLTDGVAVAGRHLRMPLLGSVEVVQAFVVIAASAAMLAATLANEHANVRVLTDRFSEGSRHWFTRLGALAGALLFAALAAGSAWVMWDLHDGAEQTELLRIPLFWLRAIWLVCAIACCGVFLLRAFKIKREVA